MKAILRRQPHLSTTHAECRLRFLILFSKKSWGGLKHSYSIRQRKAVESPSNDVPDGVHKGCLNTRALTEPGHFLDSFKFSDRVLVVFWTWGWGQFRIRPRNTRRRRRVLGAYFAVTLNGPDALVFTAPSLGSVSIAFSSCNAQGSPFDWRQTDVQQPGSKRY